MHILPPHNHPAREMFAVEHLAKAMAGAFPIPCEFHQCRKIARDAFSNSAAKRIIMFRVNPTNDNVELVSVGIRGGIKTEWTFGPVTSQAVLM